jgi:hypothetical protein
MSLIYINLHKLKMANNSNYTNNNSNSNSTVIVIVIIVKIKQQIYMQKNKVSPDLQGPYVANSKNQTVVRLSDAALHCSSLNQLLNMVIILVFIVLNYIAHTI